MEFLFSNRSHDMPLIENRTTLSKLSWRDRKRGRKGIHLTENGSNKRHVILMGVNARAQYQMPV